LDDTLSKQALKLRRSMGHALQQMPSQFAAEALRARAQAMCTELLERVLPRGQTELMRGYALPLSANVLADFIGLPPGERARLRSWCSALTPPEWRHGINDEASRERVQLDMAALLGAAGSTDGEDPVAAVWELISGLHGSTMQLIGNGAFVLLRRPGLTNWLMCDPHTRMRVSLLEALGEDRCYRRAPPLALMQAEVGLAHLLARTADLRLAVPADTVPWHIGPGGRQPVRLPLQFSPAWSSRE
jgi:hypothetical protein